MGRFTDKKVQEFLDSFDDMWISLHHESPELSSGYTSEITGGTYERAKVTFGRSEGRYNRTISPAKFSGLPAVRVTHVGGWDEQVNGELDFYIEMDTPIRMKLGQAFTINAGDIVISLD